MLKSSIHKNIQIQLCLWIIPLFSNVSTCTAKLQNRVKPHVLRNKEAQITFKDEQEHLYIQNNHAYFYCR